MAQGASLKIRLFIEGVEVPVVAATVASSPNSPATASIQIIPTDTAFFFKPRTVIHLFFLDYIAKPSPNPDDQFKLLFAGEVVGFSFMKEISNRFMVLQCEDFSNIWDYTHQYYFNLGSDNAALDGRLAQIGGQSQASFNDLLSPLLILQKLVNEGAQSNNLPRSFPGLTGLLGGVIHLIESLTGFPGDGKIRGNAVNPFFVTYNLRNRITDQIFAALADQTSAKLFELLAISDVISRDLGQAGYRLSLREIINTLLGYVYFSVVNNTTPKYVGDAGAAINPEHTADARKNKGIRERQIAILKDARNRLLEARSLKGPSPKGGSFGIETTLKQILEETNDGKKLLDNNDPLFIQDLERRDTVSTDSQLKAGNEGLLDALIRELEEEAKGIPTSGAAPAGRKDRLHTFIFRPDVYFLPPPKCNVIFPELYDQFNFSRSFLNEPSRLLVDTAYYLIDQNDPLLRSLKLRAVAPNTIPSITGDGEDPTDALVGFDPEKQKTTILPHEQFTGIIMDRRTFPDIAVYFARSQLQKEGKGSGIPAGTIAGLNVPYLRDASNFEFFRSRFQARSLNIAGRFNPFVVMGFPALVIDKLRAVREEVKGEPSLSKDAVVANQGLQVAKSLSPKSPVAKSKTRVVLRDPDEKDVAFQTGVHFLGLVGRLQHSVNQQGGNTFIDLSHAHLHNESTGFEREQDISPGKPGAAFTTASLEDFLFPPWFDEIYLPKNIGQYYREAFGSGSIMLLDRDVVFTGFAAGLSAAETPESFDSLAASVNNPEALEQAAADTRDEITDKRKDLHTVSNVHGSLNFKIFDLREDKDLTFRDSKFLGSVNVSFNAERDKADDIKDKLDTLATAVSSLRTGIDSTLFILNVLDRTARVDSTARLSDLSKSVDEGVATINNIIRLEEVEKGQLARAQQDRDGSKQKNERNKIDPRKFKNDVRRSVEALVTEYAQRVKSKQNVSEFVNAFIHRDIATLPQMLGIEDGVNDEGIPKRKDGFYALAVGGAEFPEGDAEVALLSTSGEKAHVRDVLDPRPERFKLALKYRNEVSQGADDLLTGAAIG